MRFQTLRKKIEKLLDTYPEEGFISVDDLETISEDLALLSQDLGDMADDPEYGSEEVDEEDEE